MRRVYIEDTWKKAWKMSYLYDLVEVFGEINYASRGYSYAYENRVKNTFSLIKSVIKEKGEILDVAAAQGNFTIKLAESGYNVTWNDIREDLVEYVRMKDESGNITYCPGNVFEISFKQPFDLIVATEIIEHVAHPDEFLKNLSGLVKPEGYIVISTPLGSYFLNNLPKFTEFNNPSVFESKQFGPNSDDHIFLLHMEEMKLLANKANLEIVQSKYYTNPLTNGHIKLNGLLNFLPKGFVFKIDNFTQKLPRFIGKKVHNNFVTLLKKRPEN